MKYFTKLSFKKIRIFAIIKYDINSKITAKSYFIFSGQIYITKQLNINI